MALIDKASLLMVPSTYEAGTLYNVLPSGNRAPDSTDQNSGYDQTRADFDFDRGSNASATRIGSDGLIKKYRENVVLHSNSFDNAAWTKTNSSVTSGQTGYDGSSNAWKIDISSAFAQVEQVVSNSGVQTFSVYAKAGTLNWVRLRVDHTTFSGTYFDLQNGAVGSTASDINSTIEDLGGGWYRCSISVNYALTRVRIYPAIANNDLTATTGSIYIQNAQLESGLVASSYLDSTSVTGKAGVLVDLPRINYDANGENGALLLEPSRQNFVTQSEYFGAWTLNGGGTGSNPVLDFGHTSPEGVDNAYKVTFDTGAGTTTSDESIMYISKSGLTAGNDYTASVYLKGAVGGEEVIVRDTEGSYTKWTLTTEWKRYEMTQAAAGSSYATSFGVRQGLGGIGTINSNAIVYMYAFQSEAGSYSSSYIPTMGTSETRAADSCSVTGVSDVIGQTEGTLFMDVDLYARDSFSYFALAPNLGSTSAYIGIGITATAFSFEVINSGVQVAYNYSNSSTGNFKLAFAYKANDFVAYVNGTQVMTDTSGNVPACSQIALNQYDKDQPLLYKQATLFKERLSNAELAALTA